MEGEGDVVDAGGGVGRAFPVALFRGVSMRRVREMGRKMGMLTLMPWG